VNYLLLALSYLLGATPTSYWVGRTFHGIDLREHGSGNLGATNALRVMGWRWAAPVMIVDVAKGFVPVWFFPGWAGGSFAWTLAFGAAAIVGHVFSVWVGFKGGKGVATSGGVFLALAPMAALGALGVWILVTFASRMVSVGSISAAVSLPILVWLLPDRGGTALLGFTTALAVFVIWAHRANVRRVIRGTESRIGRKVPEAPYA
jgi:glycerol-3-phosphate acyltransferase PlsY